jgi:Bacterial antitoxin of type II TA system, VapB
VPAASSRTRHWCRRGSLEGDSLAGFAAPVRNGQRLAGWHQCQPVQPPGHKIFVCRDGLLQDDASLGLHRPAVRGSVAAHRATNLAIDPDLLERALAASGERRKKAAVTRAPEEFIARREQARILGLFGTAEIDPEYDYKAELSRGCACSSIRRSGRSRCAEALLRKSRRSGRCEMRSPVV